MNDIHLEGNTLKLGHGDSSVKRAAPPSACVTQAPVPVVIASLMRDVGQTGLQTHVRTFRDALQAQGDCPALVTPYSRPMWEGGTAYVAKHIVQMLSPPAALRWYRYSNEHLLATALRQRLKRYPRCVIYTQCPVSARAALRARTSASQIVVMAVHFNVSQADELVKKGTISYKDPIYRAICNEENRTLQQLDGLVFVSQFMRGQLQHRIPSLAMVPSAVLPNFVPDPGSAAQHQVESQSGSDLISIGSLEPRKNQAYLLDILAAARAAGCTLSLTLAGDGPDRSRLRQRAKDLGVAPQVRFAGYVADGARLLPAHRAYIHAATMENMPLTLIESLSFSKPVFAPAVGGIPEIFTDGSEGRYLPLDDAAQAARIVIDWLRSPQRMAHAATAARSRYLANFESTAVAADLKQFLQSVAVNERHAARHVLASAS
ncbi:MAG: glycosyltransferase family 4 protein [Lacisediminimonas sp.]|nr:glycosyltransferase family 4 protein [Lacisediminimonas sp.]